MMNLGTSRQGSEAVKTSATYPYALVLGCAWAHERGSFAPKSLQNAIDQGPPGLSP